MDYVEWSATVDMLSGIDKRLSLLQQEAPAWMKGFAAISMRSKPGWLSARRSCRTKWFE